ncbi:hypothetical protein Pmani_031595 [Petrolisthes manimaculis]|uniref:Uncharacterized protein n=1 Tax=Petrolisthes manimaculis TaxID=1843537 RepID=A0AAE1TRU2_9EUCA|nr:hypothetical protein Pmani_031595 [Petrolisthes manimaculis]
MIGHVWFRSTAPKLFPQTDRVDRNTEPSTFPSHYLRGTVRGGMETLPVLLSPTSDPQTSRPPFEWTKALTLQVILLNPNEKSKAYDEMSQYTLLSHLGSHISVL